MRREAGTCRAFSHLLLRGRVGAPEARQEVVASVAHQQLVGGCGGRVAPSCTEVCACCKATWSNSECRASVCPVDAFTVLKHASQGHRAADILG